MRKRKRARERKKEKQHNTKNKTPRELIFPKVGKKIFFSSVQIEPESSVTN